MVQQRRQIAVTIAGAVFDLRADLAEGPALPCHGNGRKMPLRMARHMGRIEVRRPMARVALEGRSSVSIRPAHHYRLMQTSAIGLMRAVTGRMTVHAARMLQHHAGLREQRQCTSMAIRNAGKVRGWAQARWLLSCGALERRHAAGESSEQQSHANRALNVHHAVLRTIGSRRGRSSPKRASALATAGPMGGTPGSPTPAGFSIERKIATSTSGISLMRSDR